MEIRATPAVDDYQFTGSRNPTANVKLVTSGHEHGFLQLAIHSHSMRFLTEDLKCLILVIAYGI